MKKFLITTILGIATTTAFGAASVRAPKLGGTATTSTNTARAGTLRAQTMKSASVSTPTSITTTQSVATPVSTETTDARIALLKGIKGFNPGQIKDTTAAQQELNAIGSRINELQTQLDQVETAQSTVLTEDTIDAIIDEKLSQLGASTSPDDTYNKTEIDNQFATLISKLPTIDGKGNINIPDSDGTNVIQFLPYYLYANYWQYGRLAHIQAYKLRIPHKFGTTPFNDLAQQYTSGWVSEICEPEQSNPDLIACGFWNASGGNGQMQEFNTISCYKGFHIQNTSSIGDVIKDKYVTFENMNESQIREHLCGNLSSDACFITEFEEKSMGVCTRKTFTLTKLANPTPEPEYYFNCITRLCDTGNLTCDHSCETNAPVDSSAINDFVDNYCEGNISPFWCTIQTQPHVFGNKTYFIIKKRLHGYAFDSPYMTPNEFYYETNEEEPARYINNAVCGNPNGTDYCYVTQVLDLVDTAYPNLLEATDNHIDNRYQVVVHIQETSTEPTFNLMDKSSNSSGIGHLYYYKTNGKETEINKFVADYCTTQGEVWCKKVSAPEQFSFGIRVRDHGYAYRPGSEVTTNLGTYKWYDTNESNPEYYVVEGVCGNKDGTDDCYMTQIEDNSALTDSMTPIYGIRIFEKLTIQDELPKPYTKD